MALSEFTEVKVTLEVNCAQWDDIKIRRTSSVSVFQYITHLTIFIQFQPTKCVYTFSKCCEVSK